MITENNYEVGLVQVRRTATSEPEFAIRIVDINANTANLFSCIDYKRITTSVFSSTKIGIGKIKLTPQVTFGINSATL